MITWFALRILDGMRKEEECWRIHKDMDRGTCVASDLNRYVMVAPSIAQLKLDSFENIRFEDLEADNFGRAESYVRFRVTRAGLIHALKFWRRWA